MDNKEAFAKFLEIRNIVHDCLDVHFSKFIKALFDVKPCYMAEFNIVEDKIVNHLERVFAYEFYYKWHLLLGDDENGPRINAEVCKKYHGWTENYIMPDMVLHGGQNTENEQLIVCEIKRKKCSPSDFAKDLVRLCRMTHSEKFSYKLGILIYLTDDLQEIQHIFSKSIKCLYENLSAIMNIESANFCSDIENVLCITYNGENCELYTLKEMTNIINQ